MSTVNISEKRGDKIYDRDIREAIKYEYKSRKLKNTVLTEEMGTGIRSSRADIVIINNYMTAIEIKGTEDRLDRLDKQIKDYTKFFDIIIIYTVEKHMEKVIDISPSYCGIYLVYIYNGQIRTKAIRKPTRIVNHIKSDLISMLWKDEMHKIARTYKIIRKNEKYDAASVEFILNRDLNNKNLRKDVIKMVRERISLLLQQEQYGG